MKAEKTPARNWPAVRMTDREVQDESGRIADSRMGTYGLKNAKRIAAGVKRLLLAEDKRRKNLEDR